MMMISASSLQGFSGQSEYTIPKLTKSMYLKKKKLKHKKKITVKYRSFPHLAEGDLSAELPYT